MELVALDLGLLVQLENPEIDFAIDDEQGTREPGTWLQGVTPALRSAPLYNSPLPFRAFKSAGLAGA